MIEKKSQWSSKWIFFFLKLYLPFSLAFYASITPWSQILTNNKATLHTPVMQSFKAGLQGQLGSGNPPMVQSSVSGTPHPPPKQPLEHTLCPTLPGWQPSFSNTLQTSTTSAALQLLLHKGSPQPSEAQGLLCSEHRPCQPSTWGQRFQLRYRHEGSHILWSSKAKLIPGFQGRSKAAGCFSTNEVIPLPF